MSCWSVRPVSARLNGEGPPKEAPHLAHERRFLRRYVPPGVFGPLGLRGTHVP